MIIKKRKRYVYTYIKFNIKIIAKLIEKEENNFKNLKISCPTKFIK